MSKREDLKRELAEELTRDAVYRFASKTTSHPELYADDAVPVSPAEIVEWTFEILDWMGDEIRDYLNDVKDN